jgi:REP element-mobilizing transposase RayT
MPRPARIHYPGAVYHVMARGVEGREIFIDDRDRSGFLDHMLRLRSEMPHSILAYCLMGNHFHFAIRVGNIPLFRIMHRLLTAHAVAFNERNDRHGHLFQARYKSVLCLNDGYLIALIRYIHMNPVRAGLVPRADLWQWSSYRHYAERRNSPLVDTRLLFNALHAPSAQGEPIDESWMDRPDDDFDPWPSTNQSSPSLREERAEPKSIDELASALFNDQYSLAEVKSGSRRREIARKRRLLAEESLKNGHSLASISGWLGCTPPAIHHLLRRGK